jgi:hypothetical protein
VSHFQSEFGGVLAPGLLGTNGATQLPELKNRSVSVGQLNQVRYTYEATDVNAPDDHKVVIYLDSKQDGVADDSTGYQTTPIAATGHDLEALVLDLQDAPPVYISARACGRRVRLSWPRSTDADLASYKLYWNEGDGATTTELTTISTVSASPVVSVDGGSGGLGSLQGVYRGAVTNATWQVEIVSVSSRTARYNNGSGWTSISFEPEQMFNLESGLRFIFESKVGDYSDGDIWSFTVGPQTVFVTDELDEDTYAFALSGIDQAGNESTKSSDVSATVTHEPDAPTAFAVTYDDTDFSLSWTNAAGVTGTKIYSNYDPAFGVLRDYVLEQNPIATITSPTTVATINAAGLDGTALFYARHYDATTEEDNCNLVTVECGNTIASAVLPPFDLTGVPSAGGKALLSWSYTVGDVEPDLFNVYEFTSEPSLADVNGASPLDTVSFTAGAIYQEFSFETSALAGQRWYVVRSQADSVEELNAVFVTVTPDSTAPSITTLNAQVVC